MPLSQIIDQSVASWERETKLSNTTSRTQSKTTSSLFLRDMIAKLNKVQNNKIRTKHITTETMGATITYECIGVAANTQLRTRAMKLVHIQGRSPNVVSDSPYHKKTLWKERIRYLWEQILTFKKSSIFERDAIEENHCLFQWSPFDMRSFFSVLTTPLEWINNNWTTALEHTEMMIFKLERSIRITSTMWITIIQ